MGNQLERENYTKGEVILVRGSTKASSWEQNWGDQCLRYEGYWLIEIYSIGSLSFQLLPHKFFYQLDNLSHRNSRAIVFLQQRFISPISQTNRIYAHLGKRAYITDAFVIFATVDQQTKICGNSWKPNKLMPRISVPIPAHSKNRATNWNFPNS